MMCVCVLLEFAIKVATRQLKRTDDYDVRERYEQLLQGLHDKLINVMAGDMERSESESE